MHAISTSSIYRDRDGDGKLSLEELTHWLIPTDYDPNNAEAVHLIQHADSDMVSGKLVSYISKPWLYDRETVP